ncbi:MAG: UMP kinase [Candidatus Burarchaeum sp.]|nr:UMP kinase [Candidatus Burarchaeum sp.]MDO8339591.1 UMP kinase [Candidatus Burarchaeum sp.]
MIVLSIGGSLINPGEPDVVYLQKISEVLRHNRPLGIIAVTGGGKPARTAAEAVRKLGGNEFRADEAAILSTRQNAHLLTAAIGRKDGHVVVPQDFDEAARSSLSGRIVVMGGTIPGLTTDADAALIAEKLNAERIINLSNVDGIYDSDPRINKKAKKFKQMPFSQLVSLALRSDERTAGTHFIFDMFACKIIARARIETHFVDGRNLIDVENAMRGKPHGGTVVKG